MNYFQLVARGNNKVYGWAAITPVSNRCVFSGVAEVSIYVGLNFMGQGIGTTLLNNLIKCSEQARYWTLEDRIFPENKPSIRLHKKCSFRKIRRREKIGQMPDGEWRDVILMER